MDVLKSLTLLLLCQSAGEALARLTGVPLPGPVIGLALLTALLQLPAVRAPVAAAAAPLVGGAAASGSAVASGWVTGLPPDVIASLAPKSCDAVPSATPRTAGRPMQVHPDAGAYAALALGLQVPLAALLLPALARLF